MEFKTTTRLFKNRYQYKIVLICSGAYHFRSGDMSTTLENLKKVNFDYNKKISRWHHYNHHTHIKTPEDLDYALKLQHALSKMSDIDIRVESPWITIYTNNKKDTEILAKIDESNVKYISIPVGHLEENTVLMPKMDYDYRITLGKTTQEHSAFVEWAEASNKLKLPAGAKKDLLKDRTWGGKHFYLTGDNNLLMAKMHLGSSIAKIERIVKK